KISDLDQEYDLAVFYEEEEVNYFEGFLFTRVQKKSEFTYFKKTYTPAVSSYRPRLSLILYKNQLLLKDYNKEIYLVKNMEKLNQAFLRKVKNVLSTPSKENFHKLFDRTDVIEEFYILYKKARSYLLANIKGISEEKKRIEFVDNFMMQILILWYLQERKFFNNDINYFITKFQELKQQKLTTSDQPRTFYNFLRYLFDKIGGNVDTHYYEDEVIGKVVVVDPAVFLDNDWDSKAISIPNKCFYKEEMTEKLISTPPKQVGDEVPLLNLLDSRDWTEGNIDEFVLGSIYEKLISAMERKESGAYYTPEEITMYICKRTITFYLLDRINERIGSNFDSLDQFFLNCDKEGLNYLFNELKTLKILDPAVGSAHFLESAINFLLDIYERIFEKAKDLELTKGFEIISSDEQGNILPINPLNLSNKEQIKLYVKFYIILSKNIYGIDINPSALKIAKARLFLTLAKHFDISTGCFIRFPNVHFNLRPGNSLIGYVSLEKEQGERQVPLELFLEKPKVQYVVESISIVSSLSNYLKDSAQSLNISGDIIKDVKELNEILAKESLQWNDFQKVLRTKEKLITILIAALNSQYVRPLNALLTRITGLFNEKLNEKFNKEYKIKHEDLKKIRTFHWLCEFPEVFLEKNGFDIVIGNPPYVRMEGVKRLGDQYQVDFKSLLQYFYGEKSQYNLPNTADLSLYFIARSLQLTKERGYHSCIITNKWLRASYGKSIRKYLSENITIQRFFDLKGIKVFSGTTVDTVIYILKNNTPPKDNTFLYSNPTDIWRLEESAFTVPQNSLSADVWSFHSKEEREIKTWIEKDTKPIEELNVSLYFGIKTGFNDAFIVDTSIKNQLCHADPKNAEFIRPILRGKDIKRYSASWQNKWIIFIPWHFPLHKEKIRGVSKRAEEEFKRLYPSLYAYFVQYKDELSNRNKSETGIRYEWYALQRCANTYYSEFDKPKIIWQRVTREPVFAFDYNRVMVHDSNAFMVGDESLLKYLQFILQSSFIRNFYAPKFIHQYGKTGYLLSNQFVKKIPIPNCQNKKKEFITKIVDCLLFLYANKKDSDTITYLTEISDCIVYELYLHNKFFQEGLYSQDRLLLQESITPFIQNIPYGQWKELDWKQQLTNLKLEEQQKYDVLTKNINNIIEDIIHNIQKDTNAQSLINKIKSHSWVQRIEWGQN
ncbi:MAG: Eco57I restriction-modification methylase domain-containing protein, partial [Candidatus Hermodarchaeota archaeon]